MIWTNNLQLSHYTLSGSRWSGVASFDGAIRLYGLWKAISEPLNNALIKRGQPWWHRRLILFTAAIIRDEMTISPGKLQNVIFVQYSSVLPIDLNQRRFEDYPRISNESYEIFLYILIWKRKGEEMSFHFCAVKLKKSTRKFMLERK